MTALIAALGSEGLAVEALKVFRRMELGGGSAQAGQATYRVLIRVCREAGLLREALRAYRDMRR